ncbi:MAG: hypothetical protein CMJ78_04445 [Planctomycetaceae bacterium]|nr:hypothetical protein [Planctomycetaceae bacterium]
MFLRLLKILAITCLIAQPCIAKDYIKVGSWNIENLGERKYGQSHFALAEHIQMASVDILALQEIHDTDGPGAPFRNSKLDQVMELLSERTGQTWQYELYPKREPEKTYQLCGVAWNSERVKKIGKAFRIPLDHKDGSLWSRHPYAVKFQAAGGKNDLVIISIHMKSNVTKDGAPDPAIRRANEAKALAKVFDTVKKGFNDEDIMIVGDTNCLAADEDAMKSLVDLGLKDLNAKDATTYVTGAPFDHILVPKDQPEFKYSKQYILAPTDPRAHRGSMSDHMLILTPVQIIDDDDGL